VDDMKAVRYELTGEYLTPAVAFVDGRSTPVWIQQRWNDGPYAYYVRKNGCGHCCTAMAAVLHGIDLDPHREYEYCRKLWGSPKEEPNEKGQDHFLSLAGVVKVLNSLGISAVGYGVKDQGPKRAVDHICSMLEMGKLVIFTSDPDDYPDNPFSDGYHWVMAVGFAEDGRILVANSSEKAASEGIQLVTPDVIEKALFVQSTADMDLTWGELERLNNGCGYVVVG